MESCESTGAGSVVFHTGDPVHYLIPVIETPLKYEWAEHTGVVRSVNDRLEQVIVTPQDEAIGWRMVPMVYVKRKEVSAVK